jgi:hypothetical protein
MSVKFGKTTQIAIGFLSVLFMMLPAQEKSDSLKATPSSKTATTAPKQLNTPRISKAVLAAAPKPNAEIPSKSVNDTLKIEARLIEIPGQFPPNDVFSYVYIMKYKVIRVLKGAYTKKEILVGHYNPRIPRTMIKDNMASIVQGNVKRFAINERHTLILIRPIDRVWREAVEDDYTDLDLESYFALQADTLAQ